MTLTLTCVVDNHARPGSGLRNEHGLAFWIAGETGPLLFDTGQTGAVLLHNLAALGLEAVLPFSMVDNSGPGPGGG